MDPNSFAFSNFSNQPPGYYTLTPSGANTICLPQAGYLHTPGFTTGLGTPLSLPTSDGAIQVGQMPSPMPHAFNPDPFTFHHQHPAPQQQPQQVHHQTFAPYQILRQPTQFDAFQPHHEEQNIEKYAMDVQMQEQSPVGPFVQPTIDVQIRQAPPLPLTENFRYHLTLNAPTAMVQTAEETPVTYLNKGQEYSVSIVDTKPAPLGGLPPRYRTFVCISFDDEQQRQRAGQCWQLWKEGRGTNEAHHRGGRLQAVEFVDPNQSGGLDQGNMPRIELESASFDGFSVIWSPVPNGPFECVVAVRFNFLSTDFSHSKGVKGSPVRLRAMTQLLSGDAPLSPTVTSHEVCYCKIKLFRDHGAERKLSNDVAHIKKTADKLKQQIAQLESDLKDFGKRKRSESGSTSGSRSRLGKGPKHKRTRSASSASDAAGGLHAKLATLQDMFTSTRPASVLFLRGEEVDDPDLHPVHLSGEPTDPTKLDTTEGAMWNKRSTNPSLEVSPTPSQQSLHSDGLQGASSTFQVPQQFQPDGSIGSDEWQTVSQSTTSEVVPGSQPFTVSGVPVNVSKVSQEVGTLAACIEALAVDDTDQPPPERDTKPVACVYIQPRVSGEQPNDNYFCAIYLMQRTLQDLINSIAVKSGVEPSRVLRTLRITSKGFHILLDEETVMELPEGQDMIADFIEIKPSSPMRREWNADPMDIQVDGDLDVIHKVQTEGYELRLLY